MCVFVGQGGFGQEGQNLEIEGHRLHSCLRLSVRDLSRKQSWLRLSVQGRSRKQSWLPTKLPGLPPRGCPGEPRVFPRAVQETPPGFPGGAQGLPRRRPGVGPGG